MSSPRKESENPTNSNNIDQIRRAQLQMQFHSTRREDFQTVEAYVKKLKSTADSLTAIGNPVSDPDLVLQLLAGLPSPQYLLIKNTISSQLPLPNFSKACSMLYEYEEKTTSGGGAAAAAESNSNSNNSSSNSSKNTVEMIHDIATKVSTVASIARELWNALGPLSGGSSSATPSKSTSKPKQNTQGNKKTGPTGGKGNNNGGKGGGGPSTPNSGPKPKLNTQGNKKTGPTGGKRNNNGGKGGGSPSTPNSGRKQ